MICDRMSPKSKIAANLTAQVGGNQAPQAVIHTRIALGVNR